MNLNKHSKPVILLTTLLGWLFLVPLSYLFPKKKNRILLMGAKDGFFIDNIKYFFLYLSENKNRSDFYFLTANKETYLLLKQEYDNILYYPSAKAYRVMLSTKVFVVDNFSWMDNCRFQLLWNTKIVQIWHGIGFKKIQRNNKFFIQNSSSLYRRFILNFVGKLPVYNALISTGEFFTEQFFKPAFKSDNFIDTGYPRNDIIVNPTKYSKSYLKTDNACIAKIKSFKSEGIKCILYAPTFRDTGGDALSDGILDLERLNKFALHNNLVFVFKLHPLPKYKSMSENFERLLWFENVLDVYPLLPIVDLMVSDYSSIYMDYLLLNRPVLFLLYDREKYETKDREVHDYFERFLFGEISSNQDELELDIKNVLIEDKFYDHRKQMLNLSYKYKDDNASARIFSFIEENYLSK